MEQLTTQYPDFWDYYGIHRNKRIGQLFNDPIWFIEETFSHASKKLLAPISYNEDDELRPKLSDARAAHSISTFFLGALIAHKLFDGRFTSLSTDRNNNKVYEFSYIWTLTCLYHDCGYTLENDKVLAPRLAQAVNMAWVHDTVRQRAEKYPHWLGMTKFRNSMKLRQSIWKTQYHRSHCCRKCAQQNLRNQDVCNECSAIRVIEDYYRRAPKTLYFTDSVTPIYFPIRKSNDINRYFAYRLLTVDAPVEKRGCIDHGIAGGYLFFDRIIRNYAKAYCSAVKNNVDTDISDFINPSDYSRQPMHFSFNQLPLFAYISDCIINHNVWSERSNTANGQIYQRLGMEKLLIPEYERVNFSRNPLLFILAVSDSIEPYKLFSTPRIDETPYSKSHLLSLFNDTSIEIIKDRIIIKPPTSMIDRLEHKLNELQDWVDVDWRKDTDTFEIIPRLVD